MMGAPSLKKLKKLELCLSPLRGYKKKDAVCKPAREPSPKPVCAGTRILVLQPPEL